MFSILSSLFGSDDVPEISRVEVVPPFSRLAFDLRAFSALPEPAADALAEHLTSLTEARGAVFVSPSAFAGHEAADSEFYPDADGWAFIRGEDRADRIEIDFSAVPSSEFHEPSIHDALLVLFAYPSVVHVLA
jgi:hypothetical protein